MTTRHSDQTIYTCQCSDHTGEGGWWWTGKMFDGLVVSIMDCLSSKGEWSLFQDCGSTYTHGQFCYNEYTNCTLSVGKSGGKGGRDMPLHVYAEADENEGTRRTQGCILRYCCSCSGDTHLKRLCALPSAIFSIFQPYFKMAAMSQRPVAKDHCDLTFFSLVCYFWCESCSQKVWLLHLFQDDVCFVWRDNWLEGLHCKTSFAGSIRLSNGCWCLVTR